MLGMSCDSNSFSLVANFTCVTCENGFVADASEPSGCAAIPAPPPPPAPPNTGGCASGSWTVLATAQKYAGPCDSTTWICTFGPVAGYVYDSFSIISLDATGCGK